MVLKYHHARHFREVVINVNEFDPEILNIRKLPRPKGNQGGKKATYADMIAAFDIETTNDRESRNAFMYIWQLQLDDLTVIGRDWESYFDLLIKLREKLDGLTLVIWVHNLSFEFQFLKGYYDFRPDEVFCTDQRKILKCTMFDCIEYRCSYLHSNMSLARYMKQMGVRSEFQKLSGEEFNYTIDRYPWTELTDNELLYCVNDVRGLVEALKIEMEKDGDDLYTIPLTSTGYVRRECKEAMRSYNHKQLLAMLPDAEIYRMLREAFRGGNTHCNRFYTGEILQNVTSVDRSSSYPDVMINYKYPMTEFQMLGAVDMHRLNLLIDKRKRAVLMRISFNDIELSNIFDGCPYLSRAKCRNIVNGVYDNGRIIKADYLETTLTDIDYKIIRNHYNWSGSNPYQVAWSRYGYLPDPYRETVKNFYKLKTNLKGTDEYYYTKAKNKLNSTYGMSVQQIKDTLEFIDGEYHYQEKPLEDLIKKNNRRAFSSYAWGVWVCAHARNCLQEAIDRAGESFIYCDTDSVKYLDELDLSDINERYRKQSEQNGAFADDPQGERHYMGVWESEGTYNRFSSLGAKKYVYEQDGKLHITIAGVNKQKGAEELGDIENFKEGFIFYKAGGTESRYNDEQDLTIIREGRPLRIRDNLYISDSTYQIGLTEDYKEIIEWAQYLRIAKSDTAPGLFELE